MPSCALCSHDVPPEVLHFCGSCRRWVCDLCWDRRRVCLHCETQSHTVSDRAFVPCRCEACRPRRCLCGARLRGACASERCRQEHAREEHEAWERSYRDRGLEPPTAEQLTARAEAAERAERARLAAAAERYAAGRRRRRYG